jgi:outer membrane immunogenic protein
VKKLLLCCLALCTLVVGAPALAADLPPAPYYRAVPPPPPLPPPCSWCGFYVGINAGGAWDANTTSTFSGSAATAPAFAANLFPASRSPKPDGFVGGGQAGFQWRVAPYAVLGVETDFQGANYKGTAVAMPVPFGGLPAMTTSVEQHSNWFGTVRARAGALVGPTLLVYGTGGLAYGQTEASFTALPSSGAACAGVFPCASASSSSTRAGWTAGGGVEWMIVPHLTFKAEYLYMDLGSQSVTATSTMTAAPCAGGACTLTASTPFRENIVRGGFNWVFGGY